MVSSPYRERISRASATPEASPRPDNRSSDSSTRVSDRADASQRRSRASNARPRSDIVCSSYPKNEVFISVLLLALQMIGQPCGDFRKEAQDNGLAHR